jgi:fermentation-respiration switch protein FrsA (DUF1100 family)
MQRGVIAMQTHSFRTARMFRSPYRRRRWRRLVAGVMILLILVVLGSAGVSLLVGWKLTHPARVPVTKTPGEVGLPYRQIEFPSRTDHLMLKGWLIPSQEANGRIVIEAHGYRGNRTQDKPALPSAKALHDAGFSVLMFDFRDEGESPGQLITVGLYERRDLLGAIDYARSLGYRHIGLLGFSMGASTALEATAADDDVEATVADSPFANLYDYLRSNLSIWTNLPNWPFTPEVLWELPLALGVNPHQVNPAGDLLHMWPRPILFIAGTADTTIPMQNSQQLFREVVKNPDDSLWTVPGAKHVGAYNVNPSAYERRIVQFFEKYLK